MNTNNQNNKNNGQHMPVNKMNQKVNPQARPGQPMRKKHVQPHPSNNVKRQVLNGKPAKKKKVKVNPIGILTLLMFAIIIIINSFIYLFSFF